MPRTSKHMPTREKDTLKRDFQENFRDVAVADIDAEAIFTWATNTRAIYDWFYPSFKASCQARLDESGSLGNMERTYKLQFLEWAPFELIPCHYCDFIMELSYGMENQPGYSAFNKAGDMLYDHYLEQFKESV